MSQPLVPIYAPSGERQLHTNLNAIDLVRDCGYSFQPGKEYAPTDGLPFANPSTGKLPSRAQEALDSVGTGSEVGTEGNAHIDAMAIASGAATVTESTAVAKKPAPAPIVTAPVVEAAPAPAPAVEAAPVVEAVAAPVEAAPAADAAPAAKPRLQRAKKA